MTKITPEEIDHIVEVLKKDHGSDYQLESKDFDGILKGIGDPNVIKQVNAKLGRTETYDDTKQALANIMASAKNYPNYQARLEKKMQRGELTESLASGLGVARDLFQIGIASGQIKQSNSTLAKLVRPSIPGLPRNDKTLDSALSNAQMGTFDAAREIEPAKQAINSGYQNDIMNARAAAGGQQGTYGALAQEASLNRNRSLMGLAPMVDNARAREQTRVDDLLARRSEQRQQGFENQKSLYDLTNNNYMQNVQTASQLGQAGRENLYGGVGNLSDSLSVLGGNVQLPNWAQKQRNQEMGQTDTPEYTGVPEMQNMQQTLDQHAAYRNPGYIRSLMAGQQDRTPIKGYPYYRR